MWGARAKDRPCCVGGSILLGLAIDFLTREEKPSEHGLKVEVQPVRAWWQRLSVFGCTGVDLPEIAEDSSNAAPNPRRRWNNLRACVPLMREEQSVSLGHDQLSPGKPGARRNVSGFLKRPRRRTAAGSRTSATNTGYLFVRNLGAEKLMFSSKPTARPPMP